MGALSLKNINYVLTAIIILLGIASLFLLYNSQFSGNNYQIKNSVVEKLSKQKPISVWNYKCVQSSQLCSASQILLNDKGQQILRVETYIITRNNKKLPRLKIIAPLGTFLPSAISVSLTSQAPLIVPFQFCSNDGCFINLDLSDEIVSILNKSKKLDVSYRKSNREIENISINLSGFPEVIKELLSDYKS